MILRNEPILLTPGPLTTSPATRQAMLRDWGSWDARFNQLTASVCHDLVNLVNGGDDYVCVPLQGSGTFAVEAALGTLVPREGKVLVPNNGAYCTRIVKILQILGRDYCELPLADNEPVSASALEAQLERDPAITHVAQVHLETSTGLLNPLDEIATVCARRGVGLIVDAMSSLGALPIDTRTTPFDALISASGKCLEGVPGMGFVLVRKRVLEAATGRCHSLALDLHDQYVYMQKTTQWRYTPPTHVVAALRAALDQFLAEGGQAARGARYQRNCDTLTGAMRALGFKPYLTAAHQAPVIVTFHAPADRAYQFKLFYDLVREAGYILYPGKLTQVETFRVGCIGAIDHREMRQAVDAIGIALTRMGISMPAASAEIKR
ncbi:2-aminoethylphosphonate--pyruvate transaminase [Burkholderia sp. L27(2015)]|uniref:2-aminoethylphosphonate--pyruvate transaminase n=1 Tax=Burkholderia sp. L27(2015) TaxID=1641858 RepID=UPI00131D0929|nr:2-aminoethylphosphonate--pyruvate transaminase [Burkholderia sp. L27(2015)]